MNRSVRVDIFDNESGDFLTSAIFATPGEDGARRAWVMRWKAGWVGSVRVQTTNVTPVPPERVG